MKNQTLELLKTQRLEEKRLFDTFNRHADKKVKIRHLQDYIICLSKQIALQDTLDELTKRSWPRLK